MPFNDPVVAGTTLVIPAIRSANYVAGRSGWTINADGTSEFSDVTVRGPVVITDPNNPNAVLASIGATGNGSFQNLAITGDMTFGSTTLLTELALRAKGVVAWYSSTNSLPNPTSGSFTDMISLSFISTGTTRLYKITVVPLSASVTGSTGTTYNTQHQLLVDGSVVYQVAQPSFGTSYTPMLVSFTGTYGLGTHTVTWAVQTAYPAFAFNSNGPAQIIIEDVGEAVATSGNVGAPGAVTKMATYTTTGSRSYDHNGTYIGAPDGDNNIYYGGGNSLRSFGNECDILLFPGSQMRIDLTGMTIVSAQLWLYCFSSINAQGSYGFNTGPETALPATASWNGTSPAYYLDQTWPVPGWGSLNILGAALNSFISSGMNSIRGSKLFSSENSGFRGFGFSGTYQPYITVVYLT